jgi:serine/threonine protein kinase
MPKAQTSCPSCQARLRLARVPRVGARLRCPKCGNPFAFTSSVETESGSQGAGAALEATVNHVPQDITEREIASCSFLRPPEKPDELGRLGRFRVLKELGRGGMGLVFLAEDLQLLRSVALKVMLPEYASEPLAKERFLREARIAGNIENDHIIAIHEVAEDQGVPFLSMPLLKGEVLADRLEREHPLPLAEVVRLAWQICDGLQAAHSRGLVHRDLKPGNIWLESRSNAPNASAVRRTGSRVKILDFGLARAVETEQHLTRTGVILGTPSYMAPEQARDPNVDARADLFSLGVMLFQMATGKLPFRGHDTLSVLFAISKDAPPVPNSLNPEMPPELSDLIMKLLEKKPERRYASADQVTQALEAIDARYFAGQAIHSANHSGPKDLTKKDVSAKLFAFDPTPEKEASVKPRRKAKVRAASASPSRSNPWKWTAIGIIGAVCVVVAAQVVIRIRHKDGSETKIEVPNESTVIVEDKGKVIAKVPNDKAKAKPAFVGDPHRRLAEMVLNHEGTLTVRIAKENINVAGMKDLPKEPFLVVNVKSGTKPIPDQALEAFEGVPEVQSISLTIVDSTGLEHLRDVVAQEIALEGENVNGDECLKALGERPDLQRLTLHCSFVSDAAVPGFLGMKRLRGLYLPGCSKLTEKGIKELTTHPTLAVVNINPITPEAAALLNQLRCLRGVNLDKVDDAAVSSLSGLTKAVSIGPGWSLSADAARRLQKALPNAVILHSANPPTEAERSAFRWALDQKIVFTLDFPWTEVKEVPTSAISLGMMSVPDNVIKTGASNLRGIRSIQSLRWFGLQNADEEVEHLASLDSLLSLWLGYTTLTAKGMERLTALKRLESISLWHIPSLTTEALSYIPKFKQLSSVGLNGCPLTESGLAELAKAKDLQDLTLEYCGGPFTGADLEPLASLPMLRHVTLLGIQLDASSVGLLKRLTYLRFLDVRQTQLNAADIAELHKALPKCAIFWDGGLIAPGMEGVGEAKQPK